MNKLKTLIAYTSSIVFIFVLWILLSRLVNASLILPGPGQVFTAMFQLYKTQKFWLSFAYTLLRVFLSFFISVIAGTLLGIFCGLSSFIRDFFEFPLAVIRATPVVAFILIALFWFKSGTVPVFVCVLMTLPIMTTAVANGFYKTDEKLLGMAHTFNFTRRQIFRYIQLPSLVPFFLNGMVSTFGLSWKVIAAGEVLSLPKNGTGTLLQRAQVHLETPSVMAITIILVAVSFIIERLLMLAVKKLLKNQRGRS
ncbi:MAG: ABC transporter permease subunit [Treponema sp.]|nr:ABC transporter permease subunit [Treponema sp.]